MLSTLVVTLKLLVAKENCEKENFWAVLDPCHKKSVIWLNVGYLVTSIAPEDSTLLFSVTYCFCWQIAYEKVSPSLTAYNSAKNEFCYLGQQVV